MMQNGKPNKMSDVLDYINLFHTACHPGDGVYEKVATSRTTALAKGPVATCQACRR